MTSKLIKIILIIGMFLAAPAYAEEVAVNVSGRGATYTTAVLDGLQQAVAQVAGIKVDVHSLYGIQESIEDVSKEGQQTGYSKLTQAMQSDIAAHIKGYISGYNVLSSEKNEEGLYIVEMTVNIEKYTAPGSNDQRRSLAVVGFGANGGKCFGGGLSSSSIKQEATNALVSAFTNTRKFSVLDRDEQLAYDLEKALIGSGDAPIQELAKLGNVKGSDYIITGKVKEVSIWQNVQNIALTGEKITTRGAKATMEYKLILFATRQVKVSSSASVSLSGQEISGKGCSDILALLMKKLADKISNDCIENIYPPRIINVKQDSVYINMGGDSVKMGSTYAIYSVGEDLVDPYTGESLGSEEVRIGKLKITDIKPKYSIGKVIEGDISQVEVNQICRQEAQTAAKPSAKKKAASQPAPDYSLPL